MDDKIVYVDSSHLAHLDLLRRKDVRRYSDLCRQWRETGLKLALSFHHSQEIAQLDTDDGIESRLEAISGLGDPEIAFQGYSEILELEIRAQLKAMLLDRDPDFAEIRAVCFEPSTVYDLRQAITEARAGFKKLRGALELGAEAENLLRPLRDLPLGTASDWMIDRKKPPPNDYDWEAMKRRMMQQVGDQPVSVRALFEKLVDGMIQNIRSEGTLHDALLAMFGLKDCEHVGLFHDHDLPLIQSFFVIAREQVAALSIAWKVETEILRSLVARLNPYDAPGYRLMLAVERARRSHPKETEAGDFVDSDHLIYAPYVGALFVDKRTHEFLAQEARRGSHRLPVDATATIHKASDWQDILRTLQ